MAKQATAKQKGEYKYEGIIVYETGFQRSCLGGRKLRDDFGYEIPSDSTGECWGIGAHKNGDCEIAEGTYKGEHLSKLWEEHPELFGNEDGKYGKEFPLLIKIIDAKSDLSIQVHPDNAYAKET